MTSSAQHAEQLAEQVLETRHRLREDRVERAVLDVLRQQHGRREHREQPGEDGHRAERHVLEHLELLLKRQLHREERAADDEQREEQQEVEDLEPDEFEQRVRRDGARRARGRRLCAGWRQGRSSVHWSATGHFEKVALQRRLRLALLDDPRLAIARLPPGSPRAAPAMAFSRISSVWFSIEISSSSRPFAHEHALDAGCRCGRRFPAPGRADASRAAR